MSTDLSGKVALVTGATSGIGLVTARHLASCGAEVVLGVRNVEAGKRVADQIRAAVPGAKVEVGPPLDLSSQASVRAFAKAMNERKGPLNILVNNAGMGYMKSALTEEGVGVLTQTNHLGPYTLTRLLEGKLVSGKARVVNVASVTHRMTTIKNPRDFITVFRNGFYEHNKLANVYMAYELQRRLGARGLQSCAADPGAVRTNIYAASPKLSKGLINYLINKCYAPPEDGAKAVIHAATVDWEADKPKGKTVLPHQDLRYYARGIFAWPMVANSNWGVGGKAGLAKLKGQVWGANTAFWSLLDWPLRNMFGGRIMSKTYAVRSAKASYDEKMAADIWDVSAEFAKLPKQPQV